MGKFWDKSEKILEGIRKKSTAELTEKDKIFLKKFGIMNGCGGKNRGISQKIILKFLTPVFFEASCDLHDFGYWKGGDEARRAECDKKFYEKILEDIDKQYYRGLWYYYENINVDKKLNHENIRDIPAYKYFSKKFFYKILAKIFYIAVRIGGRKYFNYK